MSVAAASGIALMQPGAVLIWPTANGEMEVAPIDRISWGTQTLTIALKRGRHLTIAVGPDTIEALNEHADGLTFLRFVTPPTIP